MADEDQNEEQQSEVEAEDAEETPEEVVEEEPVVEDEVVEEPMVVKKPRKRNASPKKKPAARKPRARKETVAVPLEPISEEEIPKEYKELMRQPRVEIYRRIAVTFFVAAVGVLAFALYLSLVRVKIAIVPKPEAMPVNFLVDIGKQEGPATTSGSVLVAEAEATANVATQGQKVVEDRATGKVELISKVAASQSLVATTRLLSKEGVLFRMKERADIPANGHVVVDVYADQPGKTGNVAPTSFTIPGLSPTYQRLITGLSHEPMTGGEKTLGAVNDLDIKKVLRLAEDAAMEAAKEKLVAQAGEGKVAAYRQDKLETTTDANPGDEREKVTAKAKVRVIGVFYESKTVHDMIEKRFRDAVPADRDFVSVQDDKTMYTVDKVDVDAGTASVRVSATAAVILKPDSTVLNKDRLLGLEVNAAKQYLLGFDSIQSVEISSKPFWVRRLPNLPDRIDIEIKR